MSTRGSKWGKLFKKKSKKGGVEESDEITGEPESDVAYSSNNGSSQNMMDNIKNAGRKTRLSFGVKKKKGSFREATHDDSAPAKNNSNWGSFPSEDDNHQQQRQVQQPVQTEQQDNPAGQEGASEVPDSTMSAEQKFMAYYQNKQQKKSSAAPAAAPAAAPVSTSQPSGNQMTTPQPAVNNSQAQAQQEAAQPNPAMTTDEARKARARQAVEDRKRKAREAVEARKAKARQAALEKAKASEDKRLAELAGQKAGVQNSAPVDDSANKVAEVQRRVEEARLQKQQREKERAEKERLQQEEAAKQEQARNREAEEARLAVERFAEQQRLSEEAKLAAEQQRLAEEAKVAAEQQRLAEEAKAVAEQQRLAAQFAEEQRLAEEARIAEQKRLAEEARLLDEKRMAEEARIAEEKRKQEEARIAEQKRKEEEARLADKKRKEEEAERKRIEAEARIADKKRKEEVRIAEQKRKEEEERIAEQKRKEAEARIAEKKRKDEEARIAEQKRKEEEERIVEQKRQEAEEEEARIAEQARKEEEKLRAQEEKELAEAEDVEVSESSMGPGKVHDGHMSDDEELDALLDDSAVFESALDNPPTPKSKKPTIFSKPKSPTRSKPSKSTKSEQPKKPVSGLRFYKPKPKTNENKDPVVHRSRPIKNFRTPSPKNFIPNETPKSIPKIEPPLATVATSTNGNDNVVSTPQPKREIVESKMEANTPKTGSADRPRKHHQYESPAANGWSMSKRALGPKSPARSVGSNASSEISGLPRSPRRPHRDDEEDGPSCDHAFIAKLHKTRGHCQVCIFHLSEDERTDFEKNGRHLRVNIAYGGCEDCLVFPREQEDDDPVRLCCKCFFDTHKLHKREEEPFGGGKGVQLAGASPRPHK